MVGSAADPNNAAVTQPYIYDLGNQATAASLIPVSSSAYNGGVAFAISNNGLVVGTESFNGGGTAAPFLFNVSSGTTVAVPLPTGATSNGNGARGVNDLGEVVGTASGTFALPYLYDGTATYLLSSLITNDPTGTWNLSNNTSSAAFGIADNGDIVGRGLHNGVLSSFVLVPTGTSVPEPAAVGVAGVFIAGLLARRRRPA